MRLDPIVEKIRKYRELKAAEYGYSPEIALKDFERLHKELMLVRGINRSSVVVPKKEEGKL
jgi:hypothetical protein